MQVQKAKEGYRHTEIGELPTDWEVKQLKEISNLIVPMRDKPKSFDGDIPWIRIEDLEGKFVSDSKTNQKVSEETIKKMNLKPYPIDTVLCSCSGNMGICAITKSVLVSNQTFIGVVPYEKCHSEYLYYYLSSSKSKLESIGTGTTIHYIPREKFEQFKLPLPTLHELQRIVSILSKVDELIQKTDQIIEQTQRLKNGLIQKLLTKGIGHQRYKTIRFGPYFLDYNIPDKWQVLTLEQCVRSDTPITYGIVQAGPHVPNGVPYIRTGDMSGDKLSIDGMLRTSKEVASFFRRSQVKAGEIVCALRGIVGKVLSVPEELEGANLTQGTARISPRHDINCRYLLWALQSEYARRQFEIFSKGTTLKEITLEQLRTIKVAIPSDINEQKGLVYILDQLELAIGLQQGYKKELAMLKAGLMQKLLTGKIRVKV